MIPHWNDAPAWAQWLAQDDSGEWHWWEAMPVLVVGHTAWTSGGRSEWARTTPNYQSFGLTLRARP